MGRVWRVALYMLGGLTLGVGSMAALAADAPFHINVGLARVVAQPGQAVHFVQLLESECQPGLKCSDVDLFVVDGDRLVTGGVEGQRIYVWFRGRGKSMRGWLPAAHAKSLPVDPSPTLEQWEGTWTVSDVRKIVIATDPTTHQLAIRANAKWYGVQLEGGEQVVHYGDVHGEALPEGNRLIVRGGDDSGDCVLEVELVDEFLAAEDNMHCGGMNVSFTDVYTRDAGTRTSTPQHGIGSSRVDPDAGSLPQVHSRGPPEWHR
jgi:hypothetical protein